MRPVHRMLYFLVLMTWLVNGCKSDPRQVDISGIGLEVPLERFDRAIFEMDQDTMDRAIDAMYERFGDFFDVFNVHIIGIGQASARRYPSYLSMFINDPTNREVYEYTQQVYPPGHAVEHELTQGFRHYLYHYPRFDPSQGSGLCEQVQPGAFYGGSLRGSGTRSVPGQRLSLLPADGEYPGTWRTRRNLPGCLWT
jgi:hypothetical protein